MGLLVITFEGESTTVIFANTGESQNFKPMELEMMETNGIKHLIPLDKIKGGGPPKDGIPSIDNPKFANVSESQFMSYSDTVIGVEINGDVKAYPLFILVWHEIVNDTVGETPTLLVSLFSENSRAFVRVIDEQKLDFVYDDDKIFDVQSNSEWNYDGLAISGKYEGIQLERIPIEHGFWFAWVAFHPDTLIFGDV